ncbi:unnamed protein product [Cylindrotheca closterium]|uniref:Uncharacterized protein n=1 Tax=Cylindrotheca closterium TaxID=2856 RepID=A0AAD2PWY2_9STRA|nr:unnamed protein product [Cylindrotheca closterium]
MKIQGWILTGAFVSNSRLKSSLVRTEATSSFQEQLEHLDKQVEDLQKQRDALVAKRRTLVEAMSKETNTVGCLWVSVGTVAHGKSVLGVVRTRVARR